MTRRLLSLLLVAWFALLVGEPEWLSPCPAHGAGVGAATAPANGAGDHDTHAAHGGRGSADAPAQHDGGHGEGHGCSCPGMSCGAAGLAMPSARLAAATPALIAAGGAALVDAAEYVPVAVEHLLPYSTAPPAGSSSARRPALRIA